MSLFGNRRLDIACDTVTPRTDRMVSRVSFAGTGLENRDVAPFVVWDSMAYAEARQGLASIAVQLSADRHRYAPWSFRG